MTHFIFVAVSRFGQRLTIRITKVFFHLSESKAMLLLRRFTAVSLCRENGETMQRNRDEIGRYSLVAVPIRQ